MKKTLLIVFTLLITTITYAGEGMWLPLLLKSLNEAEMQSMGMKMSAEDIYSVNKSSLKDAIVQFGGCTGELISAEGLLLTNHHCGYGAIQAHSTLDHNYLRDGFWAPNHAGELPSAGMSAKFIVRIEDVTEAVLRGVDEGLEKTNRQSLIDKNLDALKKSTQVNEHEEIMIRPFFDENQYFLFVTMTYTDIRLVGTPPESIGKFGSDTDNWVWPRHTGDFSMFRIYADANNMPAEYSENNVPFKPKYFLPVSMDGISENDFTLVFGFPGRTDEYLPSYAVSQIVDVLDPAKIAIRDAALKIVDTEMRADEAVRLQYASKYARIANYWKKWIGEVQGLQSTNAVDKKKVFEKEFTTKVQSNPQWKEKYGDLLPQFQQLYQQIEPYAFTRDYYNEVVGRNVELLGIMNALRKLVGYHDSNNTQGYDQYKERLSNYFNGFYKDYRSNIDQQVFAALIEMYFQKVDPAYIGEEAKAQLAKVKGDYATLAASLYGASPAANAESILALLEAPADQAVAKIKADPLFRFTASLSDAYEENIVAQYTALDDQISDLQRTYMKALMEVFPERRFYPDANSTMRVTYGQVKGYSPNPELTYDFQTYLSGVMDKYVPGDYEFDVPKKLQQLYADKDYGAYGENGKMPVCFIGSNHTTGGNSGSPAIDAYGNLIGLNFDRVWEGTMSDINYDPSICRNIMVDIRYVLFIVDKYAGAGHLVKEMKLVHPKQLRAPGDGAIPMNQSKTPSQKELEKQRIKNRNKKEEINHGLDVSPIPDKKSEGGR